jgi:hypothetical protein
MLHWDVTAEDILTQDKFPHSWKQLNYIIRVQISVGQVSYFLIPVVSSFHKINYKRFLKKTYTLSQVLNIFVKFLKPVCMMLVFINLRTVSYHLGVLTSYYFFSQIKNESKITNKLLILFFFLKFPNNKKIQHPNPEFGHLAEIQKKTWKIKDISI